MDTFDSREGSWLPPASILSRISQASYTFEPSSRFVLLIARVIVYFLFSNCLRIVGNLSCVFSYLHLKKNSYVKYFSLSVELYILNDLYLYSICFNVKDSFINNSAYFFIRENDGHGTGAIRT